MYVWAIIMNNQHKRQRMDSPQENPLRAFFSEEFLKSTFLIIPPTTSLSAEDILGPFITPQRFSYQNQQSFPQYFSLPQLQPTSMAQEAAIPQFTSVPSFPPSQHLVESVNNQQSQQTPRVGEKRKREETGQSFSQQPQDKNELYKQRLKDECTMDSAKYDAQQRILQNLPCPEDHSPEFANADFLYKESYKKFYQQFVNDRDKLIADKGGQLARYHVKINKPKLTREELSELGEKPYAEGYLASYKRAMQRKQEEAASKRQQTQAAASNSQAEQQSVRAPAARQSVLPPTFQFFSDPIAMNTNAHPPKTTESEKKHNTP